MKALLFLISSILIASAAQATATIYVCQNVNPNAQPVVDIGTVTVTKVIANGQSVSVLQIYLVGQRQPSHVFHGLPRQEQGITVYDLKKNISASINLRISILPRADHSMAAKAVFINESGVKKMADLSCRRPQQRAGRLADGGGL